MIGNASDGIRDVPMVSALLQAVGHWEIPEVRCLHDVVQSPIRIARRSHENRIRCLGSRGSEPFFKSASLGDMTLPQDREHIVVQELFTETHPYHPIDRFRVLWISTSTSNFGREDSPKVLQARSSEPSL